METLLLSPQIPTSCDSGRKGRGGEDMGKEGRRGDGRERKKRGGVKGKGRDRGERRGREGKEGKGSK